MTKINNLKNKPITCLTAYSYPIAKIVDKYADVILVGDSLGMVIYGMENTRDVTIQMMIDHGKAVTKAAKNALVMIDIPFGSFEKSNEQALTTAQKIIDETNCDALKIEVNQETLKIVEFLVKNKIPLVGHVGLLPQMVEKQEDYKYQGKDKKSAEEILQIALKLEEIGVLAIVIEAVPASLADKITNKLKIPTIGIGASNNCDGQVLVIDDILGLNQDFKPKFVKKYANLNENVEAAVKEFCDDVKSREFPDKEHLV